MPSSTVYYLLTSAYLIILSVVCVYGLHRYCLVYLYYRHRRNRPTVKCRFSELPPVTIQLPMFNERLVAQRIIEAACRINYPRERLQIQVLDDSTDDSAELVRHTVSRLQAAGHPLELIRRRRRVGFKAGALNEGLLSARGEFVCIFDADFVPPPNILTDTIDYFTDPDIGMVQVRWEHINRSQSLLTRTQAILLDGHFVVEHGARSRSGRFMNFNGTAGIWRARCIHEAGGWQHDTLTEDLDLSYRAQMRGWKFLFLPTVEAPAELPPKMSAFKAQQHRWTKGGAQTCKKLLPAILKSRLPWRIKLEAFFHLTSNTVYIFVLALICLLFPVLRLNLKAEWLGHNVLTRVMFDFTLLLLATFSASSFYICSQRELNRSWWQSIKWLPALISLGIGITANNARAMLEGFFGNVGEFVRTPKYGVTGRKDKTLHSRAYSARRRFELQPWIELVIGVYLIICLLMCLRHGGLTLGIPFLVLFATGYLYVALSTLLEPRARLTFDTSEALSTEINTQDNSTRYSG